MSINAAVRTWIARQLDAANLPGGAVAYADVLPDSATYPAVRYARHVGSGRDVLGGGTVFVAALPLYAVTAITDGTNYDALDAIIDGVNAALHGASGDIAIAGRTYQVQGWRIQELAYPETVRADGKVLQYRHAGGIYQFFVQVIS